MSFFYFLNSDLDEKYGPVRLLTSADDLNNITNNGTYWYWTDSVPANAPYNNAAVVEVSGSESSTTQKIQRVTRYGVSGQSAFRALDTAGWKEWASHLTNVDFQDGTATIAAIAGQTVTKNITFKTPFSVAPKVFCNIKTSSPANKWANAGSISKTGFTIYLQSDYANDITVDWFAR